MSDELVTLPNITLISVGSWLAHTNKRGGGEVTFTEEDLKNIMASMEAPDVKEPRMVLGHTGATEGPGMSAVADEGFFGEQPAIGKFINCHLSADNQDIIGDLVGVPAWLAKILPTAYPSRSVEVYWDVPSGIPGAPNHACLMPRVALLGTNLPAVATLEDLRVFFSEDGPAIEPDLANATRRIAASRGEQMPQRAAASVQFEDVRREFYNNFATEASGRYWWWITAVYVDPPTLIVDDEEESLWSVPYTVNGDAVEFGEPVKIKVQYVEEESGKVAASRDEASSSTTERHYTKAASRPSDRKQPPKEAAKMEIDLAALRERTGLTVEQLPDGATEEQINTALAAKPPETTETEPAGGGEPAPAAAPGAGEGEQVPAGAAAAATEQSGTITVDRAAWEEQQRQMAALSSDLNTRVAAARDSVVTDAIRAGKIPPSRKEHYVKLMTADPEGTTALLAELEAVIPAEQRETGVAEPGGSQASSEAYDLAWLSETDRARVEAARAGTVSTPRLVLEG